MTGQKYAYCCCCCCYYYYYYYYYYYSYTPVVKTPGLKAKLSRSSATAEIARDADETAIQSHPLLCQSTQHYYAAYNIYMTSY